MTPDRTEAEDPFLADRRMAARSGTRRPWLLIIASLLLAALSAVLWAKWTDSRLRAEQLRAELKQVYAEAESLRTQAEQARQRVNQIEQQLRALSGERPKGGSGRERP